MKNTIVVLLVLLLSMPVFAQNDVAVVYPKLDNFLRSEKNNHGLMRCLNKKQFDYKRFTELYNQQNHAGKKKSARPVTFMDGPVVFSTALPVEISRDVNTLYQRYSADTQPSGALMLLGFVGGIAAAALLPPDKTRSIGSTYNNNITAIEKYLQSTHYQHDR